MRDWSRRLRRGVSGLGVDDPIAVAIAVAAETRRRCERAYEAMHGRGGCVRARAQLRTRRDQKVNCGWA